MAKETIYEGYDVKLRKKVRMKDCVEVVMSTGMLAVKGVSVKSGTGMYKILRKATPEEIKKSGVTIKRGGKKKMTKKGKKETKKKKGSQSDEEKSEKRKARRLARKAKKAKEGKKNAKKGKKKSK